jgi:SRSO17 transposase
VEFATKPQLAIVMIEAALDAGLAARFVAGDEVYGLDPQVRARLRARGVGYVLAIARNQRIQATDRVRMRADDVAAGLTEQAWELRTCGTGSKGERFYEWAWVHDHTDLDGGVHTLLVRRNTDTGELAFYRCWSPQPVSLSTLVMVAGRRWMIEEAFQAAKTQVGLDHYQCRTWAAWHRHALFAMLALAILVIAAAQQRPDRIDPRHDAYVLRFPSYRGHET